MAGTACVSTIERYVGRNSKDPVYLSDAVRQKLGPVICQSLVGTHDALHLLTLDPPSSRA